MLEPRSADAGAGRFGWVREPRTRNAFLLAFLLPLWIACTALHVKQVASGQLAWVGVHVAAAPGRDGFPVVRGLWPGTGAGATGGLAVGDRLLRVGTDDLLGVGSFGFVARTYAVAAQRRNLRVPLTYERRGALVETTVELIPVAFPWRMLPLTGTLVITAALVMARRPGARVARGFFLLAIAYALHWTFFFGGSRLQTYAWTVVFLGASLVMLPLILRMALIFPAEVAPPGGRLPWWPWLFAAFGPVSSSWVFGVPLPLEMGFRAVFIINIVFIATLLALLTRNFRRAGPVGRRQLKWVILGMYVGTVPVLLTDVVTAIAPHLWWLHEVAVIGEIIIPICVLVAIVRANLFDVDRLITGTAVYSFLSILLFAAVLIAVPRAARIASIAAGLDPHAVQLTLSLVVAAAVVPGRRFVEPRIERLLFRERHAFRSGVEDLLRDLATTGCPAELLELAGQRLDTLLRPQALAIFAPLGGRFMPVFARGMEKPDATPTLAEDSATIRELRARATPLDLEQWAAPRLEGEELAALERLRAAVILPVGRGAGLAATIWLGHKRSGDVYTATDLALLAAVADKLSGELQRFDAADVLRQERAMVQALRRYVPEPVAARLTRGQSIEGGEREVSVLFVDIRGYTTYSEQQMVGTVFSLINRYMKALSAVIQQRGGTVVEFLGDGLMAVFGAPEPLPEHAQVAVQTAREVVATVRKLARGLPDGQAPIAAGVGIASGRAFVGNIQTSDRLVYTAVGDVVNLASRIQGLTRELEAAIAIDSRTHRTAGDTAARFERHERVRIRGRAQPEDVYSLPLSAA